MGPTACKKETCKVRSLCYRKYIAQGPRSCVCPIDDDNGIYRRLEARFDLLVLKSSVSSVSNREIAVQFLVTTSDIDRCCTRESNWG